jgi:3',5'-cyclic-AMP phosphodiesterase
LGDYLNQVNPNFKAAYMDFSFIQITDHHLTTSETELLNGFSTRHALRTVLQHIAQNIGDHADFIISTGDLVENPSKIAYQAFLHMLNARNTSSEMPGPVFISAEGFQEFPLYLLPGNHDDRNNFFKYLFPKSLPAPLMNVAFIHKGIQFICLDWGPHSKAAAHPEMLSFLAQSVETNLPSIILMHHQLVKIGSRWLDDFIADDLTRFWKIVTGHNVLGIFCGHVHTTYERIINDIPIFGLRSTAYSFVLQDEPLACLLPPHYRLVTVQNGILTTRIFEVPL